MATRARPEGCCSPPRLVRPLRADDQDRLVAAFKALADPTRLEIVRLVAAQPAPVCVCDIVDRFDLSQPTISHHLKVLRDGGLLRSSKVGIWAFYEIEPDARESLGEVVESLLGPAASRSRASA
jgi:ArsR family transcriptional regulator, arsenate/arsenite/antimonite-responsive transcriptional repressor